VRTVTPPFAKVMFDLVGKVLNESYLVREYIESPL
jgi:hypothetical protein